MYIFVKRGPKEKKKKKNMATFFQFLLHPQPHTLEITIFVHGLKNQLSSKPAKEFPQNPKRDCKAAAYFLKRKSPKKKELA